MNILPTSGPMSWFVHRVPDLYTDEPAGDSLSGASYLSLDELSPATTHAMFRDNGIDVNYVFPPSSFTALRSPLPLSPAYSPDPSDCLEPSPQIPFTPLIEVTPYDSPVSLPPTSPRKKSHKSSGSGSQGAPKSGVRKSREGSKKQKKQASKPASTPQCTTFLVPPSPPSPLRARADEIKPTPEEQMVEDHFILELKEGECLQWREIAARFKKQFGKTMQVAALQMRYTRMRNRGRTWTEEEDDMLQRATDEILKCFWPDVAHHLARLGVTERIPADVCRARWRQLNEDRSNEPVYMGGYHSDA